MERLEDRLLLSASVEEFPLRSIGEAVEGLTYTGGIIPDVTAGVNGDPNLYFTMPLSSTIGVYNPVAGGKISEYPIPTENADAQNLAVGNSGPGDLVAGSDGSIYFVESASNQLGVFSPTQDAVIAEYPILSSSNAGLQAITSGPDGNIWFTESNQNAIGEFNIKTHQFTDYNVPTSLSDPYGITSDPVNDAVWFTESNTNNIGELNLQTHVFSQYNLGSSSLNPGNIAYDATNANVYFIETQTKSIGWLSTKTPGNGAKAVSGLQDNSLSDHLTVDHSGNVWATEVTVSDYSTLNISTGKLTTYGWNSELGDGSPEGITLGADGQLWMSVASGLEPTTTAGKLGTEVPNAYLSTSSGSIPGPVITDANGNLWWIQRTYSEYDAQIESFSLSTHLPSEYDVQGESEVDAGRNSHGSLALDTQNNQIYFTQDIFSGPAEIGVINPTTGSVATLAALPSGSTPAGITYNAMNGGYLWFTDEGLNKIGYINPGGNVAYINTRPAGDTNPDDIVADSSGNLWVSWYGSGTVDRFTPTGAGSWLSKPITLGSGTSSNPTGLTIGPDGNLWVVETGQVQVINPSTQTIIESIPLSGNGSIMSRPEDNRVWVTTSNSIVSIATGTYATTVYSIPSTMATPEAVVADETDHNVYFTATGSNKYPNALGVIALNPASQPDQLAITTPPPTNVTKGVGFGLVVGVMTSNNVVDGSLNTINGTPPLFDNLGGSVTIKLGADPNGDTLGGTLTEPVNNGVAVFAGLTLDKQGSGEVLSISYTGLSSISSSPITVALAATKLAVETQPPASVGAGQAFTVAFEAVDSNGNLDTSYNGPISVTTGPASPTGVNLGGVTLIGATNGIATFNTLSLSKPGSGYSIAGSDPNGILNPISSSAFMVVSGPPASITASAGTPQSAMVETAFSTPLQAMVEDENGDPVSGATVIFSAPFSGAGGSFTGNVSVTTNSSGVATAPAFTANTIAGNYIVTATVAGVSGGATFNLTNTPGVPSNITAIAGTPQNAAVGTAFANALQAVVMDQFGNVISGANVTFKAPSGTGVANGNFGGVGMASVATNSFGVAMAPQFTANTIASASSYIVTATVDGVSTPANFTLTNVPGAAAIITATAGTPQNAAETTTFATAFQVTVTDKYGNPINGATVTFSAPATGASGSFAGISPTTATTDSTGVATAPAFTANTLLGSYVVTATVAGVLLPATFSLLNLPGMAFVTPLAGTPQSAVVARAFTSPLQAVVKDQFGNPISGVNVTFAAPASGASGTFASGTATSATTNSAGVAVAPAFTANTTAGNYTVTATVPGVPAGTTFSLTNTPGVPASITATSGTPQNAAVGTAFATALQATVLDQYGNPVNGVIVTFAAPATGPGGSFAGGLISTATTNASGVASALAFTANTVAGNYNVTTTVTRLSKGTSFSLTNTPGPATSITASAGTTQSAVVATNFTTAFQATVKDQFGNLVSGATVVFTAPTSATGVATGNFFGNASATVTTNASGVATAPPFTANTSVGIYTVSATTIGVSTGTSFNLTNTPGVASSITVTAGTSQSAVAGTAFKTTLQATVTDQFGDVLSGVSVTFKAPAAGASGGFSGISSIMVKTNSLGVAAAPSFIAGAIVGSYTVTATVTGVSASATFNLSNLTGPVNDFLGNGRSAPMVFRRTTANTAQWFVQGSSTINGRSFGAGGLDVPVTGDFDGDGKPDLAVYRPSTGQWFAQESSTSYAGQLLATFGGPKDIPVPADYSGSGKTTLAVYRPTTGQWFFNGQSQPLTFTTFKIGDIPVPGNYDNTGKDEPAIYRPSTGQWIIDGPNDVYAIAFGGSTDIPVPGAYNALTTGNAAVGPALWRPSTGQFFIRTPTGATRTLQFAVGDIPVPGDYDGVGETEPAVYNPANSQWLAISPNQTASHLVATFGGSSDTPTAAPYVFRALKSGGGVISKFSVETLVAADLGATARSFSTTAANRPSSMNTPQLSTGTTSVPRLQPVQKAFTSIWTKRLNFILPSAGQTDGIRS
jgi:streptogramin lyase